jgi:hypothetical protein
MKSKILSCMIPSSPLAKTACSAFASLLVVTSSVMAAAPGGPTVTVKDPVAVTVTGPVSVQGSVGVTGPVLVDGYVEVVNDSLKTVFNKRVTAQIQANFTNAIILVPTIPSGKRLVIEAIGVTAFLAANSQATAFFQATGIGDVSNAINIPLPLTSQGVFGITPREHYMGLHQVRIVVDPRFSTNPQFNVFKNGASDLAEVTCTILGYLEDIPATQ